jgi:hypothetical protein
LTLGEGLAIEVVVSTVLGVARVDSGGNAGGLGAGAAIGGLEVIGDGLELLGVAARFDELVVALATVGACGRDALAGLGLDASSRGVVASAALVAGLSTAAPVLVTVAGAGGVA